MKNVEQLPAEQVRPSRLWLFGIFSLVLIFALRLQFPVPPPPPEPASGVVVESQKTPESGITQAAKAGLQEGDVIQSWSRADVHGQIESPFDLADVDVEQRPVGTVVLKGLHGQQKKSWKMGPDDWNIVARPVLSRDLLATYQQSGRQRKQGSVAQAAQQIEAAAGRVTSSDPLWLRPWLLSRAAEWRIEAKQSKESDDDYESSVRLASALGPQVTALLLRKWADALNDRGEQTRSAECYSQSFAAVEHFPAAGLNAAQSLLMVGYTDWGRGDARQAESHYQQALDMLEKLAPNSLDLARALNTVGVYNAERGDLARAQEYYRRGLAIQESLAPGGGLVAGTLLNIGVIANMRMDLAKAEAYYRQSRAIFEKAKPGNSGIGATSQGLGLVYQARGDWEKAEEYHRESLAIWRNIYGEGLDAAGALGNLGELAWDKGDYRKAEEFDSQALAIQEKLAPGSIYVSESYDNLGKLARKNGNLALAEERFQKALGLKEKLAPGSLSVAGSYNNLSDVFRDRGDLAKAEEYDRKALAIQHELAPGSIDAANSLYSLAAVEMRRGKDGQAVGLFERAVNALESQTSHLGGTEEARSAYGARYGKFYRDYMAALLASNQPDRAFHVLERSRARSLLSMLAERDLVFSADLPPDIRHERKVNAADYDRVQARMANFDPVKDAEKIKESLARLRELATQREQITERVKRISPRLATLQYPQPLGLSETRQVLDPGTVLLSYSVGEDHTTLFVVQPNDSQPALSTYSLPIGDAELRRRVEEFRLLIGQQNTGVLNERSRQLYDLLVKPAETGIAKSARLLIAPDGPLHILPFAALRRDDNQYLMEWKPIHTIVSATLYAELKKGRSGRPNSQIQLIAFGDPRYPSDPRQIPPERSSVNVD